MGDIFFDVKVVADYTKLQHKLNHIEGFINPIEGFTLLKLAEEGPGAGAIVEIGSLIGKSTCWLVATGAKRAFREKVTAIDHFEGSPEHQTGQNFELQVLSEEGTTFNKFIENIKSQDLYDYIEPIQTSSEIAAKDWNRSIRLLFIDADHSYESTKKDFLLWFPFICDGGIICFHDIGAWKGCTQFYQELLASSYKVKEIASVGSLRAVQKFSGS